MESELLSASSIKMSHKVVAYTDLTDLLIQTCSPGFIMKIKRDKHFAETMGKKMTQTGSAIALFAPDAVVTAYLAYINAARNEDSAPINILMLFSDLLLAIRRDLIPETTLTREEVIDTIIKMDVLPHA